MSTLTLAVLALCLLIGPALIVLALDILDVWGWGTETHTISTRDLPNTAPDLTPDPRTSETSTRAGS